MNIELQKQILELAVEIAVNELNSNGSDFESFTFDQVTKIADNSFALIKCFRAWKRYVEESNKIYNINGEPYFCGHLVMWGFDISGDMVDRVLSSLRIINWSANKRIHQIYGILDVCNGEWM